MPSKSLFPIFTFEDAYGDIWCSSAGLRARTSRSAETCSTGASCEIAKVCWCCLKTLQSFSTSCPSFRVSDNMQYMRNHNVASPKFSNPWKGTNQNYVCSVLECPVLGWRARFGWYCRVARNPVRYSVAANIFWENTENSNVTFGTLQLSTKLNGHVILEKSSWVVYTNMTIEAYVYKFWWWPLT